MRMPPISFLLYSRYEPLSLQKRSVHGSDGVTTLQLFGHYQFCFIFLLHGWTDHHARRVHGRLQFLVLLLCHVTTGFHYGYLLGCINV